MRKNAYWLIWWSPSNLKLASINSCRKAPIRKRRQYQTSLNCHDKLLRGPKSTVILTASRRIPRRTFQKYNQWLKTMLLLNCLCNRVWPSTKRLRSRSKFTRNWLWCPRTVAEWLNWTLLFTGKGAPYQRWNSPNSKSTGLRINRLTVISPTPTGVNLAI